MIRAADQRASDADREEVVERLRIAAGEGRIGHDELDERLSRALSAKTYRQLHATVDDIPRDRGTANRRMPQARRTVGSWTVKAVRNEPWLLVLMLPLLVITLTLAAIGMMVWFVFIIAVLALGRSSHHRTHHLGRRRAGQMSRGPGSHSGIAGSGWRWN
jgi:hypothetical protein